MIGAAKMGMHFVGIGPEELAKQMDPEIVKSTLPPPGRPAAPSRSPTT